MLSPITRYVAGNGAGAELYNAARGPDDRMPLTTALFQIIANQDILVWNLRVQDEGNLTCSVIVDVSEPDRSKRQKVAIGYDDVLNMLAFHLRRKGSTTAPAIYAHCGNFYVLPVQPFLTGPNACCRKR